MFGLTPTGCPSLIDEVTVWFAGVSGKGERSAGPPSVEFSRVGPGDYISPAILYGVAA